MSHAEQLVGACQVWLKGAWNMEQAKYIEV